MRHQSNEPIRRRKDLVAAGRINARRGLASISHRDRKDPLLIVKEQLLTNRSASDVCTLLTAVLKSIFNITIPTPVKLKRISRPTYCVIIGDLRGEGRRARPLGV